MFGTSGVRGPVGETVTAELALSVGRALALDCDRVVVGRDPRESGELLTDALAAGLRESGTDVLDIGVAATPTIARAVGWLSADAGVAITASHNPAPDNGIKLWQPSGQAFDDAMQNRIADHVEASDTDLHPWNELGTRKAVDARQRHVEAITATVEIDDPPSVVVDLGNGAGAVSVEVLQALGCSVETLNAQPDGSFPGRPSEPTAEHCESLADLVGASDADLGIAHDGDADRMRAVTGQGEFISGDVLLAMLAREAADPGQRVAVPVDTSMAVDDHLAEIDVEVARTKVGDVYVAERVTEPDVVFGGEPSGAWIWPNATLCPDGPLAAAKLAALAAERPLEARLDDIDTYPIRRENVETTEKTAVMERVAADVTGAYDDVTTLDGVRVGFEDGWFLIRASGTQPLVRVTAEARDSKQAQTYLAAAISLVEDARDATTEA
ncbi:phosphoglucosamine mutase [Halapricum hydrolyticum]|uniref:Phosphoglucosamine mutase n=1 Tax=Halapricum hydrolyticum TaxID=2979991 RepID=A0AAE3IC05_9EURY|nr:phosphoglucosamine mutase [Halapricum hydrolyticum]MCU4718429.1 phosphoglucosamine mutase [Halapricum hydrolyticum]MCU4726458.1 phosphoglucosamine mutase [Halapricum hydrolyticum]